MSKTLVLAAAALAFSAVSASAQIWGPPGYEYVYSTPVLDLAVPSNYGYYDHVWPPHGYAVVRRTPLYVAYDYEPRYRCGLWNSYCHWKRDWYGWWW